MNTVQAINDGNIAQIKLGGFTTNELKTLIRVANKIKTRPSTYAVKDALDLISYYNQ